MPDIKCSICGLSSEYDKNFNKKKKLCNRHLTQINRHGKPTDCNMVIPSKMIHIKNCCSVCGDTESIKYYIWRRGGEYQNQELCNKHYNQLIRHGYLLDTMQSKHQKRHKWTSEEDQELETLYKEGISFDEICQKMNMPYASIASRSCYLKLGEKYMRDNNPNFKAPYQDYDWCFERYVVRGMSHEEMADECGASLRVIQKWCSDKYRLNCFTFKDHKKLSDIQYQIILFGTLGDGHISKTEDQPIYIECHALDEKDYMFWKYNHLKDLCSSPPQYYQENYVSFGTSKQYYQQPNYRLSTRIVNQLKEIREMARIEKINHLNELGLCLHVLDDGNRNDSWILCLAEYSQEEIELYIRLCKERFGLNCYQLKDNRYIRFDANSSREIDKMILKIFPNDLDIVKKKITNNSHITKAANYTYVILDDKKIGLTTYCRSNGIPYVKTKEIMKENNLSEIQEADLLQLIQKEGMPYAV